MRSYPKINEREITERKRMRPLWTYIKSLAAGADKAINEHAALLGHYMRQNGFEYADLTALRGRPRHYDTFTASDWEWFLHQVMNQFSDTITKATGQ